MLTRVQQHALDRFAKSLLTLADDFSIDAYHQAWEDHRDARAEDSDNLDKACAESLRDQEGRSKGSLSLIIKAATSSGTRELNSSSIPLRAHRPRHRRDRWRSGREADGLSSGG